MKGGFLAVFFLRFRLLRRLFRFAGDNGEEFDTDSSRFNTIDNVKMIWVLYSKFGDHDS